MKSRKMGLFLLAASAWLLSGCSLAVPGAGAEEQDRLIGAYITTEYLELFDMDSYLNDHAASLFKQKETVITNTSGYEGKLYADIDKSNGEDPADWKVTFGDVDGICFFAPLCTDGDGAQYWGSVCGEGVTVTDICVNVSDTEESRSLNGTLYVLPGDADEEEGYYVNPVYQTAEGTIYAMSGNSYMIGDASSEGEKFTTTLTEESTQTEGSRAKTEKCSVALTVEQVHRPIKVSICQMDADNKLLKKESFAPGSLPESITPVDETAYIVVETQKEGADGEKEVSREICEYEEEEENVLSAFYPLENGGILARQDVEVKWKEAQDPDAGR